MKKNKKGFKKNNSIPKTPAVAQEKRPQFIIGPESSVVITIEENGRYKCRGYDNTKTTKERKEIKRKNLDNIQRSYFIDKTKHLVSTNGQNWYKMAPGRKYYHFDAHDDYTSAEYCECTRRLTVSAVAVQYAISEESCPYGIHPSDWKKASIKARLEYHLGQIANNHPFTYQILN